MRIYLPEKVIFTEAARPRYRSLLGVDESSCLPIVDVNNCFVI